MDEGLLFACTQTRISQNILELKLFMYLICTSYSPIPFNEIWGVYCKIISLDK